MHRLVSKIVLLVLVASVGLLAQSGSNTTSVTTINTDPVFNTNVFWTNPPIVASDINFVNQVNQSGTSCYAGSSSTNDNCYYSSLSGSLTIMNESASNFAGLIIQPTFSSAVSGMSGSIGNVNFASSNLQAGSGRINSGVTNAPLTSQYATGDFAYIFLRMSDYFGGTNCSGSGANQANCVLAPGQQVVVPYSFVSLPANVIFNVYSVGTDQTIYDTNANSSTSGVLASLGSGGHFGLAFSQASAGSVPEPATLLLTGGGVLALLRSRRRKKLKS